MAGAVAPRVRAVRAYSRSLGDEVVEFARAHGGTLLPWQEDGLRDSMAVDDEDRWVHFECGDNVARQNGKGEKLMWREIGGVCVVGEKLIVHSAHEFATSQEHFRRVEETFQNNPDLHALVKDRSGYRHSHGDESINLKTGARIVFKTRTKSGLRGFAGVDLLVLDEAMIINEASHGAMMPTLRASKAVHGPQLIYAGSAVDQEIHEHGVVWARIRERGLRGDDPSLCYLEFSVDAEHPDDVSDEMAEDEALWHQANPSLGVLITAEHMQREQRSMAPRTFAVELLGVGDWPATDGAADVLISREEWDAIEDALSKLLDPVCFAFDVSPDRRSSVAVAGRNEEGLLHVEVVHARAGTGWLEERMVDLYRNHDVAEIVCDGYGPSAAIARKVDEAGIKVRRLDSGEYGIACGLFVDAVGEKTLRHLGQDELNAAIRGAKARPLVDRWAWSRTKSSVDISPLVAATLALWSAVENDVGTVSIF